MKRASDPEKKKQGPQQWADTSGSDSGSNELVLEGQVTISENQVTKQKVPTIRLVNCKWNKHSEEIAIMCKLKFVS